MSTYVYYVTYSHELRDDISVNNRPHIGRWSLEIVTLEYNIILTIVLQLPAVFSKIMCCTGL